MDDLADRLIDFSRSGEPRGAGRVWRSAQRRLRSHRIARATSLALTFVGLLAVVALVTRTDRRQPTQVPPSVRSHGRADTQNAAAISLAQKMLEDARLPSGSRHFSGATPKGLGPPLQLAGTTDLVFAHRLWAVNEAPHAVWQWIQANPPHGYAKTITGSATESRVLTLTVEDELVAPPTNISYAELRFAIVGDPSGSTVIRGDSVVAWTKPRPDDEFASTTDKNLTINVVHLDRNTPSTGTLGRRVSTSDPELVAPVMKAFNALTRCPPAVSAAWPLLRSRQGRISCHLQVFGKCGAPCGRYRRSVWRGRSHNQRSIRASSSRLAKPNVCDFGRGTCSDCRNRASDRHVPMWPTALLRPSLRSPRSVS